MSRFVKGTLRGLAATALAAGSIAAHAGGPLSSCYGSAIKYAGAGSVTLRYDAGLAGNAPGTLGTRTKTQADTIVNNAIVLWTNVTTSTVALTRGTDLPVDVYYNATSGVGNYTTYYGQYSDGINPVIYDTDGAIIDRLAGSGASNSILGFAGSAWSDNGVSLCQYVEGQAVINGKINITDATMTNVIAHEVGHLIGMDHSQLDSTQGLASSNYPLMYPIAYRTLYSLHEDDAAAVTALYPDVTKTTAYGELTGNFLTAGGAPIRGANIYTQGSAVVSGVSDYLSLNNGAFRLVLPPGTYTLRAEAIDPSFDGGSSVGPHSEDWTRPSFQPPLYSVGGTASAAPSGPMPTVTLGNGTPTQITITAGCVATATFRIDGTGTVGGNCVGSPPATPTSSNPSGTITTPTPTYLWTAVSGATSYDLLVQTPGGADVFLNNYTVAAAGCPGGSGACAITPANALGNASFNWFVRARNAAGVSGWSSARSITVSTASMPAVPVPAQPNGTITTLSPTYLWTPSPGATGYNVRLTNSGGEIFNVALTLAQAGCPSNAGACGYTAPSPLTNAVAYTWQVSASNAAGASAFSTGMPFTTNTVSVPSVPVPSQPNGTISNTTPTYLWTPSPGATGYTVTLTGLGGFTTTLTLAQAGCPSNAGACGYVQPSALGSSSYSWQVRANNAAGSSAFSTAMPFTVSGATIPAPPALGSPNGANITLTPMYLWTPSAGATVYTLRVQTTTGTVVINNQVLTLSQAGCPTNAGACGLTPATSLTAGTSYTWQVAATNSAGTSAFSAAMAFSTAAGGSAPATPAPGAPNGGNVTLATGADLPFFLWTPSPGATAYTFRLHAADGSVLSTSTSSTLAQVGCPTNAGACGVSYGYSYVGGTTYQWSIRAENASGASAYSTPRPFTIVYGSGSPPLPPALGNPSGMAGTTTPFYLWTPSATATGYTVRVMNGTSVVSTTALTLSQASCPSNAGACGYVQPTPLAAATTFTWQVSASNAGGTSAYSSPNTFTTP